ncbi:MAG: TldD/PmbA family protein, partial [Candidatus Thermoplasmatota archaeon]
EVLVAARTLRSTGVGVTIYAGGGVAHVHAASPTRAQLREQIARGVRLAKHAGRALFARVPSDLGQARHVRYRPTVRIDPAEAANERVLELLREGAAGARAVDPEVVAEAALGVRSARTFVVSSVGSRIDIASLVSTVRVLAKVTRAGRLGTAAVRLAGERGLEDYAAHDAMSALGQRAVLEARESLDAIPLASGRYRVLCDNELAGTLAHESFGHLTEFDLVSSGWSTLRGRLGETIAAPGVTISDAPISPGEAREGVAVPYDDQGVAGQKVTMLRDGVLSAWMHTRESALAEGHTAGGNGRALDARFPVIVRMRNTFFEPGDATVEEALEAVGDGLYLLGARGGAPHSDGSFMFTSIRGFFVKGGKLAQPVRTAAIHGDIFEFLKNVEMVADDFRVSTNVFGGCGKRDQSFMHVGVGGPHVLVRDALVGGV